ncbi:MULTISPECIES: DUF1003 domain-containing protein [unclassified Agrococcus]|uniref:DUF1003 domain-containing protein n=1 Tax=unclassified Agrococcus TaxID=2615065 RepID=UPI0036167FFA
MADRQARDRDERQDRLATPKGSGRRLLGRPRGKRESKDRFGGFSEAMARGMGTPWFLVGMTIFVAFWLGYNSIAPHDSQFDPQDQGFPLLTLALSLQASYAAPMILLAQNRQDDRDRVQIEQDRVRAERNLNDTEYLAREVVALRLAIKDMATKDFIRAELRSLLEDIDEQRRADAEAAEPERVGERPEPGRP